MSFIFSRRASLMSSFSFSWRSCSFFAASISIRESAAPRHIAQPNATVPTTTTTGTTAHARQTLARNVKRTELILQVINGVLQVVDLAKQLFLHGFVLPRHVRGDVERVLLYAAAPPPPSPR
jgi:hypothetical protein